MKRLSVLAFVALLCASAAAVSAQERPAVQPPANDPTQPDGTVPGFPGVPGFPQMRDYKELVGVLVDTLDDNDPDIRASVAQALARIGKQSVEPLMNLVKDKDRSAALRANAAYVLGQIGPQANDAIPVLTKALKEKDPELRKRVAFAIANIVGNEWDANGFPFAAQDIIPARKKIADPGIIAPKKADPDRK
jgi:hypothetical protein